jgi:hypothetical protein
MVENTKITKEKQKVKPPSNFVGVINAKKVPLRCMFKQIVETVRGGTRVQRADTRRREASVKIAPPTN